MIRYKLQALPDIFSVIPGVFFNVEVPDIPNHGFEPVPPVYVSANMAVDR